MSENLVNNNYHEKHNSLPQFLVISLSSTFAYFSVCFGQLFLGPNMSQAPVGHAKRNEM